MSLAIETLELSRVFGDFPAVDGIGEEGVLDDVGFEERVFLKAVAENHVVDALERVAGDARVLGDNIEVVGKRTFPVLVAEAFLVEAAGDEFEEV